MLKFIGRRAIFAAFTILIVSAVVFGIFSLLPFDPAALTCGQRCTDQIVEANRVRLGFDKPIYEQYWLFLSGIFLGRTYGAGSAAVGALLLWLTVGIGLGIVAAKFKNRWPDTSSSVFVLLATSLPTFVTGLALLIWVSIKWKLIPLSLQGYTSLFDNPFKFIEYFILPWITLAIAYAAIYTRFTRAALLETLGEDYIRTARAKGVGERVVFFKHTLRAVLAPLITLAGLDFAGLIGGAIITETIFNLPGLGRLTLRSVYEFDLSVVLATTILAAVVVILMNLIVDMLYAVLDPRVRIT
ncbi:MAG: ABC transporter permease [Actinobacteria bacterium]|nr:ABC transporter permease [Actinomycetota bacterium]